MNNWIQSGMEMPVRAWQLVLQAFGVAIILGMALVLWLWLDILMKDIEGGEDDEA